MKSFVLRTWIRKRMRRLGVFMILLVLFTGLLQSILWRQFAFEATRLQIVSLVSLNPTSQDMQLGAICNSIERYTCSTHYFSRVVDRDPNNLRAVANLAIALGQRGKFKTARPYFVSYFSMGGSAAEMFLWYGRSMAEDDPEALADWAYYALGLNPHYRPAAQDLVKYLQKEHRYNEALSVLALISQGQYQTDNEWRNLWFQLTEDWERQVPSATPIKFRLMSSVGSKPMIPVRLRDKGLWHVFSLDSAATQSTLPRSMLKNDAWPEGQAIERQLSSTGSGDIQKIDVYLTPTDRRTVSFQLCDNCEAVISPQALNGLYVQTWNKNNMSYFEISTEIRVAAVTAPVTKPAVIKRARPVVQPDVNAYETSEETPPETPEAVPAAEGVMPPEEEPPFSE